MKEALIGVCVVFLTLASASCFGTYQNNGGCSYKGTGLSLGDGLTFILGPHDLSHESNITNAQFEVSVRAGQAVKGGHLLLSSKEPDQKTGGKRFVYRVQYIGTTNGSSDVGLSRGDTANLTIHIYVSNTSDPFLLEKKFFNGSNEMTGKVSMPASGQRTDLALDKEYTGVTIYPNGHDIHKSIQVRTPDWSFDVEFSDHILCKD